MRAFVNLSVVIIAWITSLSAQDVREVTPLIAKPVLKKPDLVYIYIHGFLEHGATTDFEDEMRDFVRDWDNDLQVKTYRWDNEKLDPEKVVAQWTEAKEKVQAKAPDFLREVIQKYETEQTPYVLIGYSLGTRLVATALKQNSEPMEYLKGIYFLGSALPADYSFEGISLPEGLRIQSYYSDKFDTVLKQIYYLAEGERAGGEIGFADTRILDNFRTACHHVHLGGPVKRDYSTLASAIGWMTLRNQGITRAASKKSVFQLEVPVGSGEIHWNEITQFRDQKILIEQNSNADFFRGVRIAPDGKRTSLGVSRNLHRLLDELKLPAKRAEKTAESTGFGQ